MSFGGHRVVPFTHAYRGPGIGAAFKGVARALREAVAIDPRETGLPTVKGAL